MKRLGILCTAFVTASFTPLAAQSLIAGVPSADATPRGHLMVAHESQLNTWSKPEAYWNSFSFATLGLGGHLELAASLYGVSSPGSGNVAIGVGFKQVVPLANAASPWEPRMYAGAMLPISLSGRGTGYWLYGGASARIPGGGPRLTIGPSVGTEQIFGRQTTSIMAGFEQHLTRDVAFVADWFSGSHELGALITALWWRVTPSLIVIAGPKLSNDTAVAPSALIVEVTWETPRLF